jgi:hypothetical protein
MTGFIRVLYSRKCSLRGYKETRMHDVLNSLRLIFSSQTKFCYSNSKLLLSFKLLILLFHHCFIFRVMIMLLFMSMAWDCVSELWSQSGLLVILQTIHKYGEPKWNDTDRVNPKKSKNDLSHSQCVHFKSHVGWPGREPGPLQWEAFLWCSYRPNTLLYLQIHCWLLE